MIPASLSGDQSEAAPRVGFACPGPAQMNYGSKVLLALQGWGGNALAFERCRHTAIQERCYRSSEGVPVVHEARALSAVELEALLNRMIRRLLKLLTRTG